MTLALQISPEKTSPVEALLHLLERIEDWSQPLTTASAVASVLRERLKQPSVRVYRFDPAGSCLHLLAAAPADSGMPLGTRLPCDRGALADAVRLGETRTVLNAYVEPDFVRRLPGETRSEVALPILRRGVVLGVVHLEYSGASRPSTETEALAAALAQPLAVALEIERARGALPAADTGTDRRVRQSEVLAGIANHVSRGDDVPAARQLVADGAAALVRGESAVLLLRHRERQMLEVAAVSGESLLSVGELIPLEGTLAGAALSQAHPVSADPLGETERFTSADLERRIRRVVAVPLVSSGKGIGVIAVLNPVDAVGAEDLQLLQSLADEATAVESMRQMGVLRQQISDASMIAEVGRAMTGTLGLEEVLALVGQAAQMLLNGQCAAVGLVGETGESLTLVSATGALRRSQGHSIPLRGSLMGWVVANGEAVITPSVSDDPRSSPDEVRQGPGVVVPLESRGQIRGALMVARREGAPEPLDDHLDALRKLGAYAAIAIDNAQLYQAQRELSVALQAQTRELEQAYADLASSQERLVVSEKMAALGRVTAGIAHEINSPLGSVLNCLQLSLSYASEYHASAGDPEVSADDHRAIAGDLIDSLTLAEGAARRVAQFVRTIKNQTRMGEEAITAFDPSEEVTSTLVLLQHELRNRNVTVQMDAEPDLRIMGDSTKFAVIVQNLLSNAIDALEGEGEVEIRLRAGETGVRLEVQDHGCGIPEEIRPRIYDYLFTTKDIGQGTGLGLSMVHSIVTSNFKGEVDFRSEVGVGTTFIVTFPASLDTV